MCERNMIQTDLTNIFISVRNSYLIYVLQFPYFAKLPFKLTSTGTACIARFLAVFSEVRITGISAGPLEFLTMLRIARIVFARFLARRFGFGFGTTVQATSLCFGKVLNAASGPVVCAVCVIHVAIAILPFGIFSFEIVTHSQVMPHLMSNGLKHEDCIYNNWHDLEKLRGGSIPTPKLLFYLSRVKNFVFLFPWDSIAVNAGSMCSTLSANRSDESDSKRTTISFSSHENIEIRLITWCCSKLWKRSTKMLT